MRERRTASLAGIWQVISDDGLSYDVRIPGTLDESNVGHADTLPKKTVSEDDESDPIHELLREEGLLPEEKKEAPDTDNQVIYSRYTRKYSFEGHVCYSRSITWKERPGMRLFLEVERARFLRLFVDEAEVPYFTAPTLATPHVFEVTGLMQGEHLLTIVCDNSYEGLPRREILASNMADDNTQTNWNGLLGSVILREEEMLFVDRLTVRTSGKKVSCYVELCAEEPGEVTLLLHSPALKKDYEQYLTMTKRNQAFVIEGLDLRDDLRLWDEGQGNLYEMTAELNGTGKTELFGIRDISVNALGRITLNSRVIFLRGNTDFSVFPEYGHMPMERKSWETIFEAYRDYGVNFVRFASACPPAAAFEAADDMGLLLMPELSLADAEDCFGTQISKNYYKQELLRILKVYGGHPSFCMLGLGNRLQLFGRGYDFAVKLLAAAKMTDFSRLYTLGTDVKKPGGFNTNDGDFVSFSAASGTMPRISPNMAAISADTGGYNILPDFSELDLFSGFMEPNNLIRLRDNAQAAGLMLSWKRCMANSGENALFSLKEDTERSLRNDRLSGMTYMGLTDYPGRNMGLFGMMNTHLQQKNGVFSDPKRFSSFCSDSVLMAELPSRCFEYGEEPVIPVYIANYSGEDMEREVAYSITGPGIGIKGVFPTAHCPDGTCTCLGQVSARLVHDEDLSAYSESGGISEPVELLFTLRSGRLRAEYPLYLYPAVVPVCPPGVFETEGVSADAISVLRSGGTVFMMAADNEDSLTGAVKTGFSAMVFNEFVFPERGTTMGTVIRKDHPVFRHFPTDDYADGRWLRLSESKAVEVPRGIVPMIGELDNLRECRKLGKLFEFRCLNGNVLFSSMDLRKSRKYPEGRNLLRSIYAYMESLDFSPAGNISLEELLSMTR